MKKILKNILFFYISLNLIISCNKMHDFHADYVKDGERIYVIAPDTVYAKAGELRLEVSMLVFNGENISESVVEWEDDHELFFKKFDVSYKKPLDSVSFIIDNLQEKSYILNIFNLDESGNRSIKKRVIGTVYGSKYKSTLLNRPITKIEGGGSESTLKITWGPFQEGYLGTEICFINKTGNKECKIIGVKDNFLIIENWEVESEINYKSFYIPELNAIDTFCTDVEKVNLPSIF